MSSVARLEEIETHWSVVDLIDVHELLDLKEEAEEKSVRELKSKAGGWQAR